MAGTRALPGSETPMLKENRGAELEPSGEAGYYISGTEAVLSTCSRSWAVLIIAAPLHNNNNHSSLLSLWNLKIMKRHSETITIPPAHVA
jgi:hypothetical protein